MRGRGEAGKEECVAELERKSAVSSSSVDVERWEPYREMERRESMQEDLGKLICSGLREESF
jgi:hypothetical protein